MHLPTNTANFIIHISICTYLFIAGIDRNKAEFLAAMESDKVKKRYK